MDLLNPTELTAAESPYKVLLGAASLIPISHYLLGFWLILIVFLYNFLEIHILQDLFTGFRGQPVVLTFNPCSKVYSDVVSKCRILHGRYLSTPWLCSPHLQTVFLQYFGNPPVVNYRRQILTTSDGGTLALDWVKNAKVKKQAYQVNDALALQQDEKNPILIIIPGLTSASDSAYIKHLAFNMAKRGWNVVVSNHRGLGGVSITSDCFYNGGWTEDVRKVIDYIHCQYPEAPLFVVGTSIGANILVKYLAEDGINVPIIGAAAICSPWDLLICDRFMTRKLVQRLYNKALTIGLKDYAQSHEAVLSRLSNWEGVKKSRSVRDFDDCATRVLGNYETVDTYYRRCSASNFVGSVMVPLLCISSLDDPVCTREAIPWDECRLNTNVVLATTQHGGHLPFFEGLAAKSVWWVRAVDEFFAALQSSPLSHRKKEISVSSVNPLESSIDHAPYMHVSEDGMVTAVNEEVAETIEIRHQENADENKTEDEINAEECVQEKQSTDINPTQPERDISDLVAPVKKCLTQLSRQNRKSLWLLAYIAIITTWPVVGSALTVFLRKKFQNIFSRASVRR
ncbi:hypothetical protein DH2020_045077 [Rehmannia glutinosa]|uniref:Serine aminopeptidase S33 domain-containing protein n=1 Tax=Rehmannia glutinosa TaxID=99300 RepID=A0ABR0UFT9_REHGL